MSHSCHVPVELLYHGVCRCCLKGRGGEGGEGGRREIWCPVPMLYLLGCCAMAFAAAAASALAHFVGILRNCFVRAYVQARHSSSASVLWWSGDILGISPGFLRE